VGAVRGQCGSSAGAVRGQCGGSAGAVRGQCGGSAGALVAPFWGNKRIKALLTNKLLLLTCRHINKYIL
jgi:hypothetical protein